jgi:outer membrane protein OmpA-like peptidoglycan-associated protein
VNGSSIKVYYDQYRLINTRLDDGKKPNLFSLWNCCLPEEQPHIFLVDNVKVAEGAHPVYAEEIIEGKIVTHNILFETGSADILPRSYAEINRIAQAMKTNEELHFSIDGHTDAVGSDESNMTLAKDRAEAVKKALVDMGISADRLTTSGYGEALPIADNKIPEGRAMNRRVEFVVRAPGPKGE